jgi:peptide/nickel transport system permease protein
VTLVRPALLVFVLVIAVALVGRYVAPHSPTAVAATPFATPSGEFLLGTDYLGEDVLSRVLHGGHSVVLFGLSATLLAYLIGGGIGLVAGYSRGRPDGVLMRSMDVLLAFPPLLFVLLVGAGAGANMLALVAAIALIQVPVVARIVRTATIETSMRGYVEAAVARGDAAHVILRREIVPNIASTVVADAGPRLTSSILLIAAVNFLGLGMAPPDADWALMISENRPGITINPWAVMGPALLIGALTVSVNVLADAMARRQGRSFDIRMLRR